MIDNKYALQKQLGIGGSSKVFSAKDRDGNEYALKIIRKDKGYSEQTSCYLVDNEVSMVNSLGYHPNLLRCLGANIEGSANLYDGWHSIKYIVYEKWANGTLAEIIRSTGPIEENISKFMFLQLACAIRYLHSQEVVHLDIKLENALLDEFFNVKLADFGSCLRLWKTKGSTHKQRGTMSYMAPEMKNKPKYDLVDGYLWDVYSQGVCLHLLLTGEFPWSWTFSEGTDSIETEVSAENHDQLNLGQIVKQRVKYLSDPAKCLLEEMLEPNAFYRIDLDEVINHTWFADMDASKFQNDVYYEMNQRRKATSNLKL